MKPPLYHYKIRIAIVYDIIAKSESEAHLQSQDTFEKQVMDKTILDKHLLEFDIIESNDPNYKIETEF